MRVTSPFKVSVPPQVLCNFVQLYGNTLKMSLAMSELKYKTQSCTAAHQRLRQISGLNHSFSPGRAQGTRRFMRIRVHTTAH